MCFRTHSITVVGLLLCLALVACQARQNQGKVIVLGLDGLDPHAIDLLMSEGRLPNFARLRQHGAYGKLKASPPLLSPVLWTTIATGKTPDQHGIGHFVAIDNATGAELPATSTLRRVKAIWSIASDADRSVATVGWWATWPPEQLNGVVVSDHTCYHFLFREGATGGSQAAVTYPAELADELAALIRRPDQVGHQEASRFIDVEPQQLGQELDFSDEISHFRWALATGESYRDIGLSLWRRYNPDLLMVYIEGTDSISHLFGHLFRVDGLAGELAGQQRRFGRAVEEIYLWADEVLGSYLEVVDDETTLIVLSDHGFKLGELHDDPSKTRDLRRISERYHREQGILYLYGNKVKRHSRLDGATQLDIAPTILALLELEVARDMPGRVLTEGLLLTPPPRRIASYEGGPTDRESMPAAAEPEVSQEILDHLRSLGYLDGTSESASPKGERNLAAVHFSAGEYQQAAEIYARLIETDPSDASLYTSLAGCLGAMGRYSEALAPLAKSLELDPLNVEAYHNRAVIHERLGDLPAAIADYQTAVRYSPSYEPSRSALRRLTGSDDVRMPKTASQQRAAELCQRASQAARRGAYAEAMQLLAEAEKLAPEYVLVYQYRANVAYLMNDQRQAEQALRKALELEPDNALFRRNLENILTSTPSPDQ
jgi:predicted AlkP superfamily phosphohydrolase/phosphomutase/Flp pilus assembly protein TadD